MAEITELKTSTDPMDKSMPAVMMTKVTPMPSTTRMDVFIRIARKLNTVRNASGAMTEKTITIASSTTTICKACTRDIR